MLSSRHCLIPRTYVCAVCKCIKYKYIDKSINYLIFKIILRYHQLQIRISILRSLLSPEIRMNTNHSFSILRHYLRRFWNKNETCEYWPIVSHDSFRSHSRLRDRLSDNVYTYAYFLQAMSARIYFYLFLLHAKSE